MHANELRGRSSLTSADWSDSALASMYAAALAFGTSETQMIWNRYAGFLVLNGFLITTLEKQELHSLPTALIGIAGLLLNSIWLVMNFAGWRNQCLWYHIAGTLDPRLRSFRLPTDAFRGSVLVPHGEIYFLAQSIPFGLSVGGTVAMSFRWGNALSAVVGLSTLAVTLIFKYAVIARRKLNHT